MSRREFLRYCGFGGLGGALGGATLIATGGATYARASGERVYRGVRVAGRPLGGLTAAEALTRLRASFATYTARPIRVVAPDGGSTAAWSILPEELGLAADLEAAIARAFAVGRREAPLNRLGEWLAAVQGERDLPLPVALDEGQLVAFLGRCADEVGIAPVDATFAGAADSALSIVPERPGRGVPVAPNRERFLAHAARLSTGPVTLVLAETPAAVTARDLEAVAGEAAALVGRPFVVVSGDRRWVLPPERLRAAVTYRRQDTRLVVALRRTALASFFAEVAAAVSTDPIDAAIVLGPAGRYAIAPGRDGVALDSEATLVAMEAALAGARHEAPVRLRPAPRAVAAEDLAPGFARLDRLLNTPLVVSFEEYRRVFGRDDLLPLIRLTPRPERPEKVAIALDRDGLLRLAARLAADLDREPRDARFAWRDGAVRDIVASQDGRLLRHAETAAVLEAAILETIGAATPVVEISPPRVASSDKGKMVITDRLGHGRTDYSFSIPNRKHNVELAIERLDGALIAPDALFSFNEAVGAQTIANGYKEGYGIALVGGEGPGKGEVRTVSSVAGGICQVSTTLFQAVYHAGLPLEERNWHLYWIPSYGPPSSPTGLQGLDATVDDQSGLDFRFRNTTGGWLAIEAVADGREVRIALRGRDPGWRIVIDPPTIANLRPADPTPQIEKTHDLAPGERLEVEHAVDGFDAVNRVRVYDRSGALLRDKAFTSNYHPSRNVVQVGVPASEPLD